ncbi:hypothetical protein [Lactiplantibacillus garii]|uniref:hypothetical protein n=1 Tax=Lactiplantibacillus garii TaxID=2306423 RepID=UPI000F62A72E|nr:hypothetical protein [Lactiplantibacillus garii]
MGAKKDAPLENSKGASLKNTLISHPWNFQTSMGAVQSQKAFGNRIDANIESVFAPDTAGTNTSENTKSKS